MKKTFTLLVLVCLSNAGWAQKTESGEVEDLLQRSRRARTTSIILVSTGPVIAVGGVGTLIYGLLENEYGDRAPLYDANGNFLGYEDKSYTTEIVVGAIGTAVGIGIALSSIHFSNKARELKKEARRAKLKTSIDRISIPGLQNGFAYNSMKQYKVSLVIPLGK
ncbi:MAG TPA: hypothetical protein VHL77_12930 [Ferruginibacter sp.]|jgi:hypothetical protein|nr:hypothetical protein [Ferruginibacter sp.]